MFPQNISRYVLQNISDTDEIVTDRMDAVSLMVNVSQEMIHRRRESIKQDIGERYPELCSRQTPITGKLFGMSCLVLTIADSSMCSSTESMNGCRVVLLTVRRRLTVVLLAVRRLLAVVWLPVRRGLAVVWLMVHRCLAVVLLTVRRCMAVVWVLLVLLIESMMTDYVRAVWLDVLCAV